MRIWFDPGRSMPDGHERHCRTARAALPLLRSGRVTAISIAVDDEVAATEALALAVVIESLAASGCLQPLTWRLHRQGTADTTGVVAALRTADQHWIDQQSTTVAVTSSGRLVAYLPV